MKIIFSDQDLPDVTTKSIFLAGPSPRAKQKDEWRHEALRILESLDYDGIVFIPIPRKYFYHNEATLKENDYVFQLEWEIAARKYADKIVFWVPRDIINGFYGFTTNVEFGEDLITEKIMYGRPDKADNIRYLDSIYRKIGNIHNNLMSLLQDTVEQLGNGSKRMGVESAIPLHIWNTDKFQSWYKRITAFNDIYKIDIKYSYLPDSSFHQIIVLMLYFSEDSSSIVVL